KTLKVYHAGRTRPDGRPRVRRWFALRVQHIFDRVSHIGWALYDLYARGGQRGPFFCRGSPAPPEDGAPLTHPSAGRRGLSRDEGDDRLPEVRLDPRGGVFLGAAADLADHDHRVGVRIVREQLQRVDVGRADERVAADADARRLPHAEARQL